MFDWRKIVAVVVAEITRQIVHNLFSKAEDVDQCNEPVGSFIGVERICLEHSGHGLNLPWGKTPDLFLTDDTTPLSTNPHSLQMKSAVLLLFLVVFVSLQTGSDAGWIRRAWEKLKNGVKKAWNYLKERIKARDLPVTGELPDDLTDEDIFHALATRDLEDLFDLDAMTDEDLEMVSEVQRHTRDAVESLEDAE